MRSTDLLLIHHLLTFNSPSLHFLPREHILLPFLHQSGPPEIGFARQDEPIHLFSSLSTLLHPSRPLHIPSVYQEKHHRSGNLHYKHPFPWMISQSDSLITSMRQDIPRQRLIMPHRNLLQDQHHSDPLHSIHNLDDRLFPRRSSCRPVNLLQAKSAYPTSHVQTPHLHLAHQVTKTEMGVRYIERIPTEEGRVVYRWKQGEMSVLCMKKSKKA